MNAIGYMRLSVRDQSRYSLDYQEQNIRDYCTRNNLELTALFKDNGESSYTFDRPDYKAVEAFIKQHKGHTQYLVIMDHDRFSRNLSEALGKITDLERKHGIKVVSTDEAIDIDPSDPDVFIQRAFKYLMANNELLRIRKRTRQGMRHAQESGRYVNRAPFGYVNDKDPSGKSIIVVDQEKASIIQTIYADYLAGNPAHTIYKKVESMGFTVKGNSAIVKVLSNCVYAGLIKVVADRKTKEHYVKAIHAPLISEADFWLVQERLGNKRPSKAQPHEQFPLRGVLKCWCGSHMTAAFSKGKKQRYLYYRCVTHTNTNLSGIMLHDKFKELLATLSFTPEQVDYISKQVEEMLSAKLSDRGARLSVKTRELAEVDKRIENLEERFLNDHIEVETYRRWFTKYSVEKAHVMEELNSLKQDDTKTWARMAELLPSLTSLPEIYERATVEQKHLLVREVFKHTLSYSDGGVSNNVNKRDISR